MVGPELNSKQDKIEKIEAIRQPKWCIKTEERRLYWKLIGAAIKDNVKTIQSCLAENPSSAKLEYWYTPPIHFAVREGNLVATQILWRAYQYKRQTNWSPLYVTEDTYTSFRHLPLLRIYIYNVTSLVDPSCIWLC